MSDDTEVRDALFELVANGKQGVLATIKRDGRPQLSNIIYRWNSESRTASISITADRVKSKNAERDPRVSLHVSAPDFWSYAVIEGIAELTPPAVDPHDEVVDALVELYRDISGNEHPDWEDYRRAMVAERRQILSVRADRVYGMSDTG
ncbi:MAG: PPOX class F420-dependent oxidoreductase [Rhodococcus sp. (in: high G+C Gram-positive bacteria)]|uniref:PPOX class F420-dependent oxidoreductase n=1 Tax=Rhodococcus sp. TaxID=1831 RepID=UPI0012239E50|nr:PPOX class F420-dependent oxidoreductase [Rhodococcus sp. (in: high G+C Gram-positive bacteria)]RZL24878.1 MAG: PPOX class F420-dependent oxidoreductase [Rhodococcus sp. (in: high G+C Gram-positive bacteria)]